MVEFITACDNCVFKEVHLGTQIGCEMGMLSKFAEAGYVIDDDLVDGIFYKRIHGVCMFRRTEREPLSQIRDCIYPKVNFVVIDSGSLEDLKLTLESVCTTKYKKIIVCSERDNFGETVKFCKNICDCDVVFMVDKMYQNQMYDEAFRRCTNGYIGFVKAGTVVDQSYLDKLDKALNDQLKKVIYVSGEIELYMSAVYKYLKGNRLAPIAEKLANFSGFTWENLND